MSLLMRNCLALTYILMGKLLLNKRRRLCIPFTLAVLGAPVRCYCRMNTGGYRAGTYVYLIYKEAIVCQNMNQAIILQQQYNDNDPDLIRGDSTHSHEGSGDWISSGSSTLLMGNIVECECGVYDDFDVHLSECPTADTSLLALPRIVATSQNTSSSTNNTSGMYTVSRPPPSGIVNKMTEVHGSNNGNHEPPLCRLFGTASGCKYGNKCRFAHHLPRE
ncbi:hypothetical protein Pelo_15970 [Pelomyxa schiedti]|nr:hypothetical protein Pelo_15970 [Pelomyxa schiedti]